MKNVSKARTNRAKLSLKASRSRVKRQTINCSGGPHTIEEEWKVVGGKPATFKVHDPDTGGTISEKGVRLPKKVGELVAKELGESKVVGIVYDEEYNETFATDGEALIELTPGFSVKDIEKKLNSGKRSRVRGNKLNSAKQIDAEWFYTLTDVEDVVAAVLAELDKDEGASITLQSSETGITLMVTSSEGEETEVPVELSVDGDELADDEFTDDELADDEFTDEE